MMRTSKWMKKLTAKELQHLAEMSASGRPTLASLKANRAHQQKMKQDAPESQEPCWDCRHIAHKLGLE